MSGDRFSTWAARARTCYRGAATIDTTAHGLAETATALGLDQDAEARAAVEALNQATIALLRARAALEVALKAKTLTPANREAEFWSGKAS